jgi:hypothetical protein
MPDEPDAQLLRKGALWSVPGIILGGLRSGISAPLRLRYAGLVAAVAAAVTLWATFA